MIAMRRRDLLKLAGSTTGGIALGSAQLGAAAAVTTEGGEAPVATPSLPQRDTAAAAQVRATSLAEKQRTYVWTERAPNLPGVPMAEFVPPEDLPSLEWLILAATEIVDLLVNFLGSIIPQLDANLGAALQPKLDRLHTLESTLADVRKRYAELSAQNPGTPVDDATNGELASLQSTLDRVSSELRSLQHTLLGEVGATFLRGHGLGDFGSTEGLRRYEAMWSTKPIPSMQQNLHDDELFAYLRVGGPNPMVLRAVSGSLPAKFPLTESQYQQVMGPQDSLAEAIAQRRAYVADYAGLGPLAPNHATFKLLTGIGHNSAPIALFVVPKSGNTLRPVAIQCGQDPAVAPLILRPQPDDHQAYWSWQMAKTVVQTADFNHHEMFVHLARTHLVSEAFCVATHRTLAPTHPLNVLLIPHFEGDLFINELAALLIMGPGTFADIILPAPIQDLQRGAGADRLAWDFYENMPPTEFAARGVADPSALPEYPYRDDALLVWSDIHNWVERYVGVYYASDVDVRADTELSAWAEELIYIGKIKGFRPITTRAQLVDVVAMIIYTASAQHAAVNYPQRTLMTYTPFMAGLNRERGPKQSEGMTEADWIKMLPGVFGSLAQLYFLNLLGSVYYRPLGEYRHNRFPYPLALTDPRIVAEGGPLARFRAALKQTEKRVTARNRERSWPYEYLLPSQIPTSTNI
jgi:arachidonate 15-lipoxygenase